LLKVIYTLLNPLFHQRFYVIRSRQCWNQTILTLNGATKFSPIFRQRKNADCMAKSLKRFRTIHRIHHPTARFGGTGQKGNAEDAFLSHENA
jgi:hypothetical protein